LLLSKLFSPANLLLLKNDYLLVVEAGSVLILYNPIPGFPIDPRGKNFLFSVVNFILKVFLGLIKFVSIVLYFCGEGDKSFEESTLF
jgi:hypothetical protein